jgi:hypothetical protein
MVATYREHSQTPLMLWGAQIAESARLWFGSTTRIDVDRSANYARQTAAMQYRQNAREYQTGVNRPTEQARRDAQNYLNTYPEPSWIDLESRLFAFASEPVVTAAQASSVAHEEFVQAFQERQAMEGTLRTGESTLDEYDAAAAAVKKRGRPQRALITLPWS